jgi:hypothetical protein
MSCISQWFAGSSHGIAKDALAAIRAAVCPTMENLNKLHKLTTQQAEKEEDGIQQKFYHHIIKCHALGI